MERRENRHPRDGPTPYASIEPRDHRTWAPTVRQSDSTPVEGEPGLGWTLPLWEAPCYFQWLIMKVSGTGTG
ncbi:hypothetical protein GCM10022252_45930 [Streptosporangium oxazolinicum]|uniref:Uncharacterized protein n=1 Tax=Streptosporangium oxazolinicum TaxID=909287 RepID=A0ABP8B466_9ACTN